VPKNVCLKFSLHQIKWLVSEKDGRTTEHFHMPVSEFQHLLQAINEGMGGQERERKDSQANTNSVTNSLKMLSLLIRCHMVGGGGGGGVYFWL
jgi:hypothetical protein